MAFWSSSKDKTRGYGMILEALDERRSMLSAREADLAKARRHVSELETTCVSLREQVADLERDQRALDRGYIAIMCDNASPPITVTGS